MEKKVRTVQRIRLRQVCDGQVRFEVDRVTRPVYRGMDREIFSVLCLGAQNQPTSFNVCSVGSLNVTRARPADILRAATFLHQRSTRC